MALLKIVIDLFLVADRGESAILIFLDLSVPFNTVDHTVLINRLKTRIRMLHFISFILTF